MKRESPVRREPAAPEPAAEKRRPAGPPPGAEVLLELQASAGNQAVVRMLAAAQTKLAVGASDDPLELEADRVADTVVGILRGAGAGGGANRPDKPEPEPVANEVHRVHRVRRSGIVGAEGGEVDMDVERAITSSRSGGRPLPQPVRERMEGAFGADLGSVRLHTGPGATNLNRQLQAKAFTIGNDIFFHGPAPDVNAPSGQHLLAHELTHVVQQTGAARRTTIQRKLPDKTAVAKLTDKSGLSLRERIRDFNKAEKRLGPSERLDRLNEISRYVYQWYATQDTKDLSSLGGADAKAIRELEASIDTHHENAVGALMEMAGDSKEGKGNETMSKPSKPSKRSKEEKGKEPEKGTSRDDTVLLLQQIASGDGPIKLVGSAEFQKKARSMLVRIMDSAMGKKLLTAIAKIGTDRKKEVTIGEGNPPSELKGHLDDPAPTESKAIPQLTDTKGKPASTDEKKDLAVELTTMTKMTKVPADPENFGVVTEVGDFHTAVMGGKRGICVKKTDSVEYYEFAKGAPGAYVALVHKELGESTDTMNEKGKSLFMPEFMTLAHELGHALNILAGAGTVTCRELFGMFAPDVGTFEAPGKDVATWSNLEEMSTIQVVENAIRKELGLENRGGHATVVDKDLEDELQKKKNITDLVGTVCSSVWMNLKEIKLGTKRAGLVPKPEEEELSDLVDQMSKIRSQALKGLTPSQKRARCNEYQVSWIMAFKTLGKMSKRTKTEVQTILNGEMKGLKTDLQPYEPKCLSPVGM